MIWHIVRFDMGGLDEGTRRSVEASLEGLAAIDDVAWLRVAHDIDDPEVTGLLTVFDDEAALVRYRRHPEHVPVIERLRVLGIAGVRLDVAPDDAPRLLP